MPHQRIAKLLSSELGDMESAAASKGRETVFSAVIPAAEGNGPRFLLEGEGETRFLRMNSNSYLGMSLNADVMAAGEEAVRTYGAGPGAVRFISGTWAPHIELERRLADFHGRDSAMIFSSAYAAMMGILPPLITPETAVISDELNHNCIINALRLARPGEKQVYPHLDLGQLEAHLKEAAKSCRRAIIVSDGIFSMRGDHAPLAGIMELARRYDDAFAENVLVVVDDSHGVGAFGVSGRGCEEYSGCEADILLATLGKAIGVNGGYVVADRSLTDYLREKSPFYVYSNPITPGEAAAATRSLEILDSPRGLALLDHLRAMTARFEAGLSGRGFETIPGEHPIVPLMTRDTDRTLALVRHLRSRGILATAIHYPVVPRGDEEIRFQISADHTEADIDLVLDALEGALAES